MPRGTNPNSKANLIQYSGRSRKEAEKKAAEGGRKSGATRRQFKTFREEIKKELTVERGTKIVERILCLAEKGDLNAIKLLLKILGEDPGKKIEITGNIDYAAIIQASRARVLKATQDKQQ